MVICLLTAAANLAVGALVGLCGVAGFLLPMFYTASLGMNVSEGLARQLRRIYRVGGRWAPGIIKKQETWIWLSGCG